MALHMDFKGEVVKTAQGLLRIQRKNRRAVVNANIPVLLPKIGNFEE